MVDPLSYPSISKLLLFVKVQNFSFVPSEKQNLLLQRGSFLAGVKTWYTAKKPAVVEQKISNGALQQHLHEQNNKVKKSKLRNSVCEEQR